MFEPFSHSEAGAIDSAIASAFRDLAHHKADSEEYQRISKQLTELHAIKNSLAELNLKAQQTFAAHQLECDKNAWQEEQDQRPFYKRLSPDTCMLVAGNLAVALVVVKYEQTGVVASKALSFMRKF